MNTTTLLNAMLQANRKMRMHPGMQTKRTFRQAQKFERRLRKVLREYDELRSIKAK